MPDKIIDTECYPDYWLMSVLCCETGKVQHFEQFDGQPLDRKAVIAALKGHRIITFNGTTYDLPMLTLALQRRDCAQLKAASDKIILDELRVWQFEREYGIDVIDANHVDLIEVAPGIAGLKTYGGRLHAQNLQDIPLDPGTSISESLRPLIRDYCANDLFTTQLLFNKLRPQIELRERMGAEYDQDLRSKSDAQIAEAVLANEVAKLTGEPVTKPRIKQLTFRYQAPEFLHYQTRQLKDLLATVKDTTFSTDDKGVVKLPPDLEGRMIKIGSSAYRMGIGGLHSSEKSVHHIADSRCILIDRDVASYYPAIILTNGLYPEQMGPEFLTVYRSIVDRRLAAKHAGDKVTADSLKITINGSFGKLGSPYSLLYAPHLLIQTTVTGQLALLMLIEMLEESGIPVVSANTDGIVIKCPHVAVDVMNDCVAAWEMVSGFETEATEYSALYSRDVNNYLAIKPDGKTKTKGVYASAGLQKNPQNEVVTDAVLAYLVSGTPITTTIHQCTDIRRFLSLRAVRGGALDQDSNHLGRVVRWYYSTEVDGPLTYASNGNTVPRSDGAQPLMQLPAKLPTDIDYHWYVREAISVLVGMGVSLDSMPMGDLLDEVAHA